MNKVIQYIIEGIFPWRNHKPWAVRLVRLREIKPHAAKPHKSTGHKPMTFDVQATWQPSPSVVDHYKVFFTLNGVVGTSVTVPTNTLAVTYAGTTGASLAVGDVVTASVIAVDVYKQESPVTVSAPLTVLPPPAPLAVPGILLTQVNT